MSLNGNLAAVVLAAGKGTRINATADKNKVTYPIANKPIIAYTVDNLKSAGIDKIVVVIGFASDSVKQVLGDSVSYAIQKQRLGTGHALKTGLGAIRNDQVNTVISLYGDDSAFYPPEVFKNLIAEHRKQHAVISFVTIEKQNPIGLGRIIRDDDGQVEAIVEEKNASVQQKQIKEINTGLYCFDRSFLKEALNNIKKNPVSKEYYLTDTVEYAVKQHLPIQAIKWPQGDIWFGVNTTQELSAADEKMRQLEE